MTTFDVHASVPRNPVDGTRFKCDVCEYAATFVVLDDGQPGEWVTVEYEE